VSKGITFGDLFPRPLDRPVRREEPAGAVLRLIANRISVQLDPASIAG
jgi:hypothetical protein